MHVYEVRPRSDKRGVDLISDALPFGRLWYGEPDAISNAVGYAKFSRRSHDAVIRVYDEAANVTADCNVGGIGVSCRHYLSIGNDRVETHSGLRSSAKGTEILC